MTLQEYVWAHTQRGDCQCGLCCDVQGLPEPTGHTVDMVFFRVSAIDSPDLETFKTLTKESIQGEFCSCNPLDGREHSYLELGAWIGDQGLAMQYMALGELLGACKVISPAIWTPNKELQLQIAGSGYLSIISAPKEAV